MTDRARGLLEEALLLMDNHVERMGVRIALKHGEKVCGKYYRNYTILRSGPGEAVRIDILHAENSFLAVTSDNVDIIRVVCDEVELKTNALTEKD